LDQSGQPACSQVLHFNDELSYFVYYVCLNMFLVPL
jgi:hypothetical protein